MPILLICVIIFTILLKYKLRVVERQEHTMEESFQQLERRASLPVKRSLESVPKIVISLSNLPFRDNATEEILSCQSTIKELSSQTICNLTGFSNTDLKLKYGAGNIDKLLEYEQNYLLLIKTLSDWGTRLYEQHNYKDAETVLDYAIFCQSDLRQTYITLTRIYIEQNALDKVHNLAKKAEKRSSTLDLKKAIYDVMNESDDTFCI